MEKDILISIIIPVYNVIKYLDKCMKSVLNQTYHNLDIILIDDGSTDGSGELCDKYSKNDERVRVIHKSNGGISSARNAALDIINGDYICFVDSDDHIELNMIETLVTAVKENACEIAICGFYTEHDGEVSIEDPGVKESVIINSDEAIDELIEDKNVFNYVWDKIYVKALFDNIRFPVGRNYEDMAIMYLLFAHAKKICRIPERLYYYNKRAGSISDHRNNNKKWYLNCIDMLTAKLERHQFLQSSKNSYLEQKSMSSLISTVYEGIKLAHVYSEENRYKQYMDFLKINNKSIKQNLYVNEKDKKLLFFYQNKVAYFIYSIFQKIRGKK